MGAITLGPFELHEPLAKGGMGVVWRGEHPGQGVPVAVKILKAGADAEGFRREVQAVAALHHPGVVMVFDHGQLDAGAAAGHPGLEEGLPWLAMEYASRGSLKEFGARLRWEDIRGLLLSILDALAHAHARGVIHRDIKPGNILLGGPNDLRPGLKLADFGLARDVEEVGADTTVTGTPTYMAPEQFRAAWREFGPWTDLYAVGIVAWELLTGFPPYTDPSVRGLGRSHLRGQLPAFAAQLTVPQGVEGWLRRMLAVRPDSRFRRAADAAWALAGLPDPVDDDTTTERTSGVISNPTMTLDETLVMLTGMHATEPLIFPVAEETEPTVVEAMSVEVPPLPPTWKRAEPPAAPMQLLGAGLNLFGLRTVPLVDRHTERDRMWDALIDAAAQRDTRLVLLQGAAGNGKTRLVQWIAQRAHEVGGATVLKATHGPTGGPMDGLAPMVERHYRCVGLDRAGVEAELAVRTDVSLGDEVALAELIRPAADDAKAELLLGSAEERWVVVERMIRRQAIVRPVVLWLDDIQWGPDALGFARWFAERPAIGPVLVLCTAQEEALGELAGASRAVDELVATERAQRQPVEALGPGDREELVRVLLGLEGPLAARLAKRTGGNPLFTVQLVGDWVARGVLVPGRDGFRLKPGETAVLPDDLHQVWSARVERLLAGRGPADRDALELAAALGQEVDREEWRLVCKQAGIRAAGSLLEELVTARLAVPTDEGWAFSHGMLRESLQRLARDGDRWAEHNRTCALALSSLRRRGLESRLGRHWFAAREYARAAELLRRGARATRSKGDPRQAAPDLALAEDALRRAEVADRDPRWGELWLERSRAHQTLNELDEAFRDARRVLTYARRYRWSALLGPAWAEIGHTSKALGDLQQSLDAYHTAAGLYGERDQTAALTDTRIMITHTLILQGQIDAAGEELAEARTLAEQTGSPADLARVIRYEGDLARLTGDYATARHCFERAAGIARQRRLRSSMASNLHGMAEMDRLMGELDRAERGYLEVIELQTAMGRSTAISRLNLGSCLVARGDWQAAHDRYTEVLEEFTRQRQRGLQAMVHSMLAPVMAAMGDWRGMDRHLDEYQHLAAVTGMTDIDMAHATKRAAELCEAADKVHRARRCWELCATVWDDLGNPEERDAALTRARALR